MNPRHESAVVIDIARRRGLIADDAAHLRKPPHSLEAEQSVLGSLLIDNSAFQKVADLLLVADFYSHPHRMIWGALRDLLSEGKPADVVTVYERMQATGTLDESGGLAYLNSLSTCVPSSSNIVRYAEIVSERATLRATIAALDEATSRAFRQDPAADVLDAAKIAIARLQEDRKPGGRSRIPMLSLGELRQQAVAMPWLVKHVIPAASIGMLYGASGTFKSFLALDACLHVAHGMPWLGRRTKQASVIYIAAEGGAGMWPRIVAWHRARRLQWSDVPLHVVPAAVDLSADAWRVVDAAQSRGVTPGLVVVDTLSQTYSGEENSANEVAAYFRELGSRFRDLWGCATLILHHSGHNATERPRGSSAMRANLDFMLGVHRDEKEMLATLSCAKQKDGDPFPDTSFSVLSHELGVDDDGDRITSLVARHLSNIEDVQDAMEVEKRAGRGGHNQLLLSLLQNGQKESELRSVFYAECGLDSAEARKKAYQRAKAWLANQGLMEVSEGFVLLLKPGQSK